MHVAFTLGGVLIRRRSDASIIGAKAPSDVECAMYVFRVKTGLTQNLIILAVVDYSCRRFRNWPWQMLYTCAGYFPLQASKLSGYLKHCKNGLGNGMLTDRLRESF